jgi:hypothetical protein
MIARFTPTGTEGQETAARGRRAEGDNARGNARYYPVRYHVRDCRKLWVIVENFTRKAATKPQVEGLFLRVKQNIQFEADFMQKTANNFAR